MTIPKACGFEAAARRVAGVSPARHAGILPAVCDVFVPIFVIGMGMTFPLLNTYLFGLAWLPAQIGRSVNSRTIIFIGPNSAPGCTWNPILPESVVSS
jgi:hypothetical protein